MRLWDTSTCFYFPFGLCDSISHAQQTAVAQTFPFYNLAKLCGSCSAVSPPLRLNLVTSSQRYARRNSESLLRTQKRNLCRYDNPAELRPSRRDIEWDSSARYFPKHPLSLSTIARRPAVVIPHLAWNDLQVASWIILSFRQITNITLFSCAIRCVNAICLKPKPFVTGKISAKQTQLNCSGSASNQHN